MFVILLYETACAPFMYGPACSRTCPCLKENTLTCDNLYGVCHCKPGWTGKDCSTDLDECLYVRNCTQNSECTNTPGSYQCLCVDGYEKDTSGRLCTRKYNRHFSIRNQSRLQDIESINTTSNKSYIFNI